MGTDQGWYVVIFKAHRQSSRLYRVYSERIGGAHFVAAALRSANWTVIDIAPSRRPGEDDDG